MVGEKPLSQGATSASRRHRDLKLNTSEPFMEWGFAVSVLEQGIVIVSACFSVVAGASGACVAQSAAAARTSSY
jgi:hypothetical protein